MCQLHILFIRHMISELNTNMTSTFILFILYSVSNMAATAKWTPFTETTVAGVTAVEVQRVSDASIKSVSARNTTNLLFSFRELSCRRQFIRIRIT